MITPKERRQLENAIANLSEKAMDYSWRGAQEPTVAAQIELEYVRARIRVQRLLSKLEKPGDTYHSPK